MLSTRFFAIALLIFAAFCGRTGQIAWGIVIDESAIRSVEIGIGGTARLGHWLPVDIRVDGAIGQQVQRLEILSLDADGVPVAYRSEASPNAGGFIRGMVWIGRRDAAVEIRLFDKNGALLSEKKLPDLGQTQLLLPATEQTLLQLGPDLGLAATQSVAGARSWRIVRPDRADALPRRAIELDSVDLILWTTGQSGHPASGLDADQIDAIDRWVRLGGRLVLSVGDRGAAQMGDGNALARFAPGAFRESVEVNQSDSLEFYAGSASGQLITSSSKQSMQVAAFENVDGLVELRQNNLPLIVRRSVGFGEVVVVCFDLESPLVSEWKGFGRLMTRILGTAGEDVAMVKSSTSTAPTQYGFRDLGGQVRAVGDRFASVGVVPFLLIAVLIAAYAICIGPLDYLLLNKLLGRMELTWITFTVFAIGFGAIAWLLVAQTKPNSVQINQTEIVDVDANDSTVRGTIWTTIYSPQTSAFDLEMNERNRLGQDLDTCQAVSFGMPGSGIGGMESRTVARGVGDGYAIDVETQSGGVVTRVDAAPVAVASTKQFFTKWSGRHSWRDMGEVSFYERGRQLAGRVRNPVDQTLHDCFLLFGNSVYLFGDLAPETTIDLSQGTERSMKGFLQFAMPNAEVIRWSPSDRNEQRVFQMLMFYRLAGGEDFTGLTNDYQNELDLSETLALGRAVFVGRLDDYSTDSQSLHGGGDPVRSDRRTTFVRIVFPVRPIRPLAR